MFLRACHAVFAGAFRANWNTLALPYFTLGEPNHIHACACMLSARPKHILYCTSWYEYE